LNNISFCKSLEKGIFEGQQLRKRRENINGTNNVENNNNKINHLTGSIKWYNEKIFSMITEA